MFGGNTDSKPKENVFDKPKDKPESNIFDKPDGGLFGKKADDK